jgi:hypothetical protein
MASSISSIDSDCSSPRNSSSSVRKSMQWHSCLGDSAGRWGSIRIAVLVCYLFYPLLCWGMGCKDPYAYVQAVATANRSRCGTVGVLPFAHAWAHMGSSRSLAPPPQPCRRSVCRGRAARRGRPCALLGPADIHEHLQNLYPSEGKTGSRWLATRTPKRASKLWPTYSRLHNINTHLDHDCSDRFIHTEVGARAARCR